MINPYTSPESDCRPPDAGGPTNPVARRTIRQAVRRLIFWLTPAAAANLLWFNYSFNTPDSWSSAERLALASVGSFIVLAMGVITAWLVGPALMIFLANRLHGFFGSESTQPQWLGKLADSMGAVRRFAPWFMVAWLIAVAELNTNGVAILGPILCHGLAACWYLPLFRAWFVLRQSAPE